MPRLNMFVSTVVGEIRKPTRRLSRVVGYALSISLLTFIVKQIVQSEVWTEIEEIQLWWVFFFAVTQFPVSMVLLTAEIGLLGKILQTNVSLKEKIQISYAGSALNLLPIPGAFLTRTAYFLHQGKALRDVTKAYLLQGLSWIFISGAMSSLIISFTSVIGMFFLFGCVVMLCLITYRLAKLAVAPRTIASLFFLESLFALSAGFRFWLGFKTLGLDADFAASIAMNSASAISSAFGIFPGGIGIREVTAQFLGSQAGVTSEAASISALAARTWGLIGLFAYSSLYAVKKSVDRVRYRKP